MSVPLEAFVSDPRLDINYLCPIEGCHESLTGEIRDDGQVEFRCLSCRFSLAWTPGADTFTDEQNVMG